MRDLNAVCQIPRIGRLEIEGKVDEVLGECWNGSYPMDVEAICDYLGIAIVPVMELWTKYGVDAFIAADFRTIYADESEFRHCSSRYRFSIAHEIGHFVLHREYFSSRVESLNEWIGASLSNSCNYVEYQANFFAGCLLAPEDELVRVLNSEYDGSFARNYYMVGGEKYTRALTVVRQVFHVSEQVVKRRIRDTIYGIGS